MIRPSVGGFEDGRRDPEAKEYRKPLEAGKGKETGIPFSKEFSPASTLISPLQDSFWTLNFRTVK